MDSQDFEPSFCIAFDWKTPATQFLTYLQSDYPELEFLDSDEFEDLIDELATEDFENCLTPIAEFLVPHNYTLWVIDFHSDTYHLALVPQDQIPSFKKYWDEDYLEENEEETFKPVLKLVNAKKKKSSSKAKTKTFNWIEDTFQFDDYSPLEELHFSNSVTRVMDHFYDFSAWPPKPIELAESEQNKFFLRKWKSIHHSEEKSYWTSDVPSSKDPYADDFYLNEVTSIKPWVFETLGNQNESLNSSYQRFAVISDGILAVVTRVDSRKRTFNQLLKVSKTGNEVWFESHQPLKLFPLFDGSRCLVVMGTVSYAVVEGAFDKEAFRDFPHRMSEHTEAFVVGDEEIIYFSEQHHGMASGHKQHKLQMNRIDIDSGLQRSSTLEGFGSYVKFGSQTVCSYEGSLHLHQGHEDWWVFNYVTNAFGARDIAWLWNSVTEEVIKISAKDFPRRSPKILYLNDLGRYLAAEGEGLSLLKEFEDLYQAKEKMKLAWT